MCCICKLACWARLTDDEMFEIISSARARYTSLRPKTTDGVSEPARGNDTNEVSDSIPQCWASLGVYLWTLEFAWSRGRHVGRRGPLSAAFTELDASGDQFVPNGSRRNTILAVKCAALRHLVADKRLLFVSHAWPAKLTNGVMMV